MELTTKTNSGLEQKVVLLESPLTEKEITITVNNFEESDNLFEIHKERYREHIYLPEWKEIVLVLRSAEQEINPENLNLLATTSYHVQASRKGIVDDVAQISVSGLVLTSDKKLVYGIRGGNVLKGEAAPVPTGSITHNKNCSNPVFMSFYEELREELGVGIEKSLLIGYQTDPAFTHGINLVFYMPTSFSSSELEEIHKKAWEVYIKGLSKGLSKLDARKEITDVGLSNADAWEHTKLVFIENESDSIKNAIDSRKVIVSDQEHTLMDIGRGDLILYNSYRGIAEII